MKHYFIEIFFGNANSDKVEELAVILHKYRIDVHTMPGDGGSYISRGYGTIGLHFPADQFARDLHTVLMRVNQWPPDATLRMWEVDPTPTYTFRDGQAI
jgi:hypothetical protein